MSDKVTRLTKIVKTLSEQLHIELRCLSNEMSSPSYDSDRSDQRIKDLERSIQKLRNVRDEIEMTMTGAL